MKINFTKMQGLGNDFILLDLDEPQQYVDKFETLAQKLCDRHFGIGADGLIIVNKSVKNTDIGWYFYNSDGTKAQMCGNGIRCFAKYVFDKKLVDKMEFSVETLAGTIIPKLNNDGTVTVNMNKPVLNPEKIPVKVNSPLNFTITAKNKEFKANAVSMGNPHCLIFTDENTKKLAYEYGHDIEYNPLFSEKTNVEFIKVLSRKEINVDVWERGCGITLACGTGACASVVAGILTGLLDNIVKVNLPGGSLNIEWDGDRNNAEYNVFMTGCANYSFVGEIEVDI